MKAIVMCGGAGSRLRPLTEARPKPPCRLLNVPVLETILRTLARQGVRDIRLSLGCKAQDITEFCESLSIDAEVTCREEPRPLGTAGGVRFCLPSSEEPVLVVSGDTVWDLDLAAALSFHTGAGALCTVVCRETEDPREYGVVTADEENNIFSFAEKPTWEQAASRLVNTGIYILDGSALSMIPENEPFDFSQDLFPLMLKRGAGLKCFRADFFWGDMGEFPAYRALNRTLLDSGGAPFGYRGKLIAEDKTDADGNQFRAPCLIGSRFRLGKNNVIGPYATLGDGVTLGSSCTVEDCILGDGVTVEDGCDLLGAIADDRSAVLANSVLENGCVVGYGSEIGKFSRVAQGVRVWPGRRIQPESLISRDMQYETPEALEIDSGGTSGKLFSQLTLSDAVRLGQALASVAGIKRVGVGSDAGSASELYKSLCGAGVRSCGVICYDFEEMFRAQVRFYALYCSLDAFVFVSVSDGTVNFSFYGANGLPFSAKLAREINSHFRFSSFRFADEEETGNLFRMNLLSTAYTAALQRVLSCDLTGRRVVAECENPTLKALFEGFLKRSGASIASGGLQFLINENGTDLYCLEQDRFYSGDRIRTLLCELEFAEGRDVAASEDVSDGVRALAERYGRAVYVLYENAQAQQPDPRVLFDSVWNFDAVFLCARLMHVLFSAGTTLAELMRGRRDFVIRKKVVSVDAPASELRRRIESAGAKKENGDGVYYRLSTPKGAVRLRQLGNTNRVRLFCEAADMETAAELTADVCSKINRPNLDKQSK